MALRIPDLLRYEIRHRLESWRGTTGDGGLRGWINDRPGLAIGLRNHGPENSSLISTQAP